MLAMLNDHRNRNFRLFVGCKCDKQGMVAILVGSPGLAVTHFNHLRGPGFTGDPHIIQPCHGTGPSRFIDNRKQPLLHQPEFIGSDACSAEQFRLEFLKDFPVGIMGLGVLGQRVARAIQQFEFPVVGWSRSARQVHGVRAYVGAEQFDEFLAETRVLVCLLPLTSETEGILNRDTLARLRPGGYLINVARGGHLVEDDLIPLLDSGHLAGATLDVFRQEPLPAGHPFWRHPKITITPHTAARTLRDESVAQIATKIARLERGESIAGIVDPQKGY